MELTDAHLQNLLGFISGLIGAIVGGLFTLYATNKAITVENQKEARQEEKEVQNLLDALGVELGTLWAFHMRRIGPLLENIKPGDAVEFYYPLTQDYFTVYAANAQQIGKITHADLRESIVVTYNKCKKVVDGFKYNNELYRDWRDYSDDSAADPARLKGKRALLVEYAQSMRQDHIELKSYIEELMKLLNQPLPKG